jgi:hypothetical protein
MKLSECYKNKIYLNSIVLNDVRIVGYPNDPKHLSNIEETIKHYRIRKRPIVEDLHVNNT